MAERAGLREGDVLTRLGAIALTDADALAQALRDARGRDTVVVEVLRGEERFESRVEVVERRREEVAGATVLYESIEVDGTQLRTIVTRPEAGGRHPAVLYLQGISDDSIDFGDGEVTPTSALVHGWAQAGLVTMRMERRGLGDSGGAPFEGTSFEREVADYAQALEALAAAPFVDPDAIFVFGHSVGGMIAPFLAERGQVRGTIAHGSSAAPWYTCVEASTRRQLSLRGVPRDELEARVAREQRELRVAPGDRRSAEYHQQLHEAQVAGAWIRVRGAVLVLHGEYDWVVGRDEQEQLCAILETRAAGRAQRIELPGLDHAMTRHVDLAASLASYGAGELNTAVLDATLAWIDDVHMNRFATPAV